MRWIILCLVSLVLAGCKNEDASYLIAGTDVALTLERRQPYFWSSGWELYLVTRRNPECQRRHRLKDVANGGALKVEVYRAAPTAYILRQGKRWYVTDLKACEYQAFKEEPPEPGELVGAFQIKGGVFRFVEAKDKALAEEDKGATGG